MSLLPECRTAPQNYLAGVFGMTEMELAACWIVALEEAGHPTFRAEDFPADRLTGLIELVLAGWVGYGYQKTVVGRHHYNGSLQPTRAFWRRVRKHTGRKR